MVCLCQFVYSRCHEGRKYLSRRRLDLFLAFLFSFLHIPSFLIVDHASSFFFLGSAVFGGVVERDICEDLVWELPLRGRRAFKAGWTMQRGNGLPSFLNKGCLLLIYFILF